MTFLAVESHAYVDGKRKCLVGSSYETKLGQASTKGRMAWANGREHFLDRKRV